MNLSLCPYQFFPGCFLLSSSVLFWCLEPLCRHGSRRILVVASCSLFCARIWVYPNSVWVLYGFRLYTRNHGGPVRRSYLLYEQCFFGSKQTAPWFRPHEQKPKATAAKPLIPIFTIKIDNEINAALSINNCDSNWPIISATGLGAGGAKNETADIVIIELTKK